MEKAPREAFFHERGHENVQRIQKYGATAPIASNSHLPGLWKPSFVPEMPRRDGTVFFKKLFLNVVNIHTKTDHIFFFLIEVYS